MNFDVLVNEWLAWRSLSVSMAHSRWLQRLVGGGVLGLLALIAYFQARALTLLLAERWPHSMEPLALRARPIEPLRARASAAAILARNAFDSVTGPLARSSPLSVPPLARHDVDPLFAPPCAKPRLVIISEQSDPEWSVAGFRLAESARAELHRIGDQVMGQRVEFIGFNPIERSPAVWLSRQGELCQALLFAHGAGSEQPAPASASGAEPAATSVPSTIASKIRKLGDDEYEIDRSVIDQIMDNQAELTKNLRIVPESKDGKTVGVRLFGIRAGSLLSWFGLQSGDLLQSINGFSMASPQSALQFYAQLPRVSALDVQLERSGAARSLSIRIR